MNRLKQSQGVVLLSRQIHRREHLFFERFEPIVRSPQAQVRFLLQRVKSRFSGGFCHSAIRLHEILMGVQFFESQVQQTANDINTVFLEL